MRGSLEKLPYERTHAQTDGHDTSAATRIFGNMPLMQPRSTYYSILHKMKKNLMKRS